VIVPTMKVWIEQWYTKEPTLGNVTLNELPGAMFPEPVNALVLEVTVCVTAPLFVQQTVVPGVTVIIEGEKLKSTIETIASPVWHEVALAFVGAEAALPPGRAITSAAAAIASNAFTVTHTPDRTCRIGAGDAGTSGSRHSRRSGLAWLRFLACRRARRCGVYDRGARRLDPLRPRQPLRVGYANPSVWVPETRFASL
jgi:hypothetical protein